MADSAWPAPPAHLHFLGICGYAVSGLAVSCRELGYRVTGADEDAYPPTTEILRRAGIAFADHHDPQNLLRWGRPALVVLGNQVQAENPELVACRRLGLAVQSEAAAYRGLTDAKTRVVVCGTHGKTTTATLLAWMLEGAGLHPGFRLGATSRDFDRSVRLGEPSGGGPFVFEGDEYTTSALDSSAKFLHWDPEVVALLNLELDHPDLYPSLQAYLQPYRQLLAAMPAQGLVLYSADDPLAAQLAARSPSRRESFGWGSGDWQVGAGDAPARGWQQLEVRGPGLGPFELSLPLFGRHNAANALAALATAVRLGADPELAARSARSYRGAARRFEILGEASGVTVVDDYAHHPTKVRATVEAARARFGPRVQLVMVHVPHTYSRTRALLPAYRHAFQGLDLLVLGPIEPARERHLAGTVSSADVAAQAEGPEVILVDSAQAALTALVDRLEPPAVVLCSSVRGFDGTAQRLLAALSGGEPGTGR